MDTYFLEDSYKIFNNNEDELALPSSPYDNDQINNRKELVEKLEKLLDKNEVEYNIESDNKKDFIKATPSLVGERKLCISLLKVDNEAKLCSYLNKELLPLGGHIKRDDYNTLFLSYDKSTITEANIFINEGSVITTSIGLAILVWGMYAWTKEAAAQINDYVNGRDPVKGYKERQKQDEERTSAFFNKIKKQFLLSSKTSKPKAISRSEAKEYYNILSSDEEKLLKQELQQVTNIVIKYYHESGIERNKIYKKYYKISIDKFENENYIETVSRDAYKCEYSICQNVISGECRINDKDDIDIDSKEYETVLSVHSDMEDICEKVQNYIKNSNLHFNIKCEFYAYKRHASILILFNTTFTPKTKESIEESDVLYLPKSAVKEANIFINTDRVEYNVDTLKPDTKNNILFITGYSGSGKSTLMAELRGKYGNNIMTVAGDHFFMVLRYKYRIEHGMPMSKRYDKYNCINDASKAYLGPILTKYFDLYYCSLSISTDSFTNPQLLEYWEGFIHWLYEDTTVNKAFYSGKIIVVEGIQISNTDPELYRNHALIITGTSALTSWARKANSDIFSEKKYDWKHIKTLFTMIPVYLNDTKRLNDLEKVMKEDALNLPDTDLQTLLDNTDPKHIYFTSDWHLLKNRYKSERNYVNCQEIVTWCRQNIKDDDIFMYLGDISYRWIDKKGEEESMNIMASLPGIKVLIAGNHDRMLGDDYLRGCGFKYIFDEYTWNNLIFTHRPINMSLYPDDYWNIHGHIHKWKGYNTTDGKKNINVYPYWFDNKPVTLDYLLKHKEKLVKDNYWNVNAMLSETKRSELPDKAFGIPEDRKYPLDTEQHVKSAIKLFGHAEESKKKKLAQNIRSAAKKYDITIPENTQCYKYLNEGSIESIIPEGITNVIFDMGGVLVNQNTLKALKDTIFADEHICHKIDDFMCDEIFTIENKDVDRWYTDDMKNHIKKIAPEFVLKHLDAIFEAIPKGMYTYIYVNELLSILRNKGYNIYYLSNWPRWLYEIEKDFFAPLISKFDGGLFSCESKYYMKPDKEFYQEFLRKFNLDPSTCLFFDNKYENISAAESVGMKACLFNDEETPKQLLGDNLNIPSDANNTILVNMGAKLESVSLDKINWWYLSSSPDNNHPDEELYYRNFDTCIQAIIDDQLKDGPIERYVFTCNGDVGDLSCIPIGQILINPDRSSEWLIQYPLEYKDGLYQTVLNEWSMAACNPICGITKPFILKMTNDSGSLINTKQYALSPDLISDKYLVVNENAQLEIVNSNKFKDCFVEIYEFVGNKAYLDKINKAYNEGKIVDNTVFYTMLTGKPMLCEDQIDFDPSFRKIDLAYMKEDTLSKLATMRDNILETKKYNSLWSITESSNVTINIPFMSKYNKHNDINLKEDFDGYYFYSSMTGKRSSSVKSIDLLTEAMIKTVL